MTETNIKRFIDTELKNYPKATLIDLYKNYFQDAYGPGHLIPDTTQAGKYLDWELAQTDYAENVLWQPLGINNDFYRINLKLLKNGIIPRNELLLAMVTSAKLSRNPAIDDWKKEWNEVHKFIKIYKPELPNLEPDALTIQQILDNGKVVMHHSEIFTQTYHPHYRIIHKSIFMRWKNDFSL